VVCTICSTNSEFSTYLGLIFQHSLEIDLYHSGQISPVLVSPHNNLSAHFFPAFLEAISATLVDSEVSIYFRHILQHSLELDLFLGGEISSYLINIYNNLSAQFLSAYFEANTATLVDSGVSIYFRQILQHSLELDLFLGGNSHLISLYNLPSQLVSAYLEDSPVSFVDSEYNTYIGSNSLHSSEREFFRVSVSLSSQYNNNLSTQLLSALLVASLVYLEETFCKYFVLNFSLVANAFSRTSMIDIEEVNKQWHEGIKDVESNRSNKKASVQFEANGNVGDQSTMAVDTEVNKLPPSKVGLLFPDSPALSTGMTLKGTEAELSITHLSNLADSKIQAKYVFVSGIPIGLMQDDQRTIREGLFESIKDRYKIPLLASSYDKANQQLISNSNHVKKAINKQTFGLIMELENLTIFGRCSDTISDQQPLLREIPFLYHYIDKQDKSIETLFHIVVHAVEAQVEPCLGNTKVLLYGRGVVGLPVATSADPSAGRKRLNESEYVLRMQLQYWIEWFNSTANELSPGLSSNFLCIVWKDRSGAVPLKRLKGNGTFMPSELMFEIRYTMNATISNTRCTELLAKIGLIKSLVTTIGGFTMQLCTDHTRFANPSSVLAAKQPYSILKKLALNQTIPDILMAMENDNPGILTRIGSVGLMEACPHPTDKILSDEEALGNALMVIWKPGRHPVDPIDDIHLGCNTIQLGIGASPDCSYPPDDKWPKWITPNDLPWMLQFKQRAAGELETAKGPHQRPRKTTAGINNQPRHQMPSYVSALNSHTTVPLIPVSSLPSSASIIHPSPLAGAGGGQDAKLLALVQSLQQRLDDVESTAGHTISELGQVKQNQVATETKVDNLKGAMKSLYQQTTAFQIEQRDSAGLAAENMSKLMLKLGVSPAILIPLAPRRQPNLDANSIQEA